MGLLGHLGSLEQSPDVGGLADVLEVGFHYAHQPLTQGDRWIEATVHDVVERGSIERPVEEEPLLELARELHEVDVGAEVTVNGRQLTNSDVRAKDSAGRPLAPAIGGAVPSGQVWVMSDENPLSFDSRYFGPLPASLIRGRMTPLWTWR